MALVKQGKCNAEEKIIELSNSIYYLEKRNSPIHGSGKGLPRTDNTLAEFSALTDDDEGYKKDRQTGVVAKFKLTKLIGNEEDDLCLSEDDSEAEELKERNPNLPLTTRQHPLKMTIMPGSNSRPSHPLKVSMPVGKEY